MDGLPALFHLGPLAITATVVTTWGIIATLWLGAWLTSRRLRRSPGLVQAAVEGIVSTIEEAIGAMLPELATTLLPFVGTLWIFITVANLTGVIPGLRSPTGDLSTTVALALLVFFSVHWYGVRAVGLRRYLAHYLQPNLVMLPFHLISEITRTVALAVRLFGNVMSLELAALLVLMLAGLLVPLPMLLLHIIEALVQAYIFGMLALLYIAGGIQSQQIVRQRSAGETP